MSLSYQHPKPPPAPSMTPYQLADGIKLKKQKEIPARALHAFLIYRKELVMVLKRINERIPQPMISKIASKLWKQKQKTVKDAYKDVAKEVQNILRQRNAIQQALSPVTASTNEILPTVDVLSNVNDSTRAIMLTLDNPYNPVFGHTSVSLPPSGALDQITTSIVTMQQNYHNLARVVSELKNNISAQELSRQRHVIQQVS